jgi:hypothetical protein
MMGAVVLLITLLVQWLVCEPLTRQIEAHDSVVILGGGEGRGGYW